jgi:hypothetical protein
MGEDNLLYQKLPRYVLTQSLLFTIVFSMRDSVSSTLDLLPIPRTNVWWRWLTTFTQLAIVILIFMIMWEMKVIQITPF